MFEIKKSSINIQLMNLEYKNFININNIEFLSFKKVKKILKNESLTDRQDFLKFIIVKWVESNNLNNWDFVKKIKHLFKKFKIVLTELDIHDLNILEERAFATIRHIKVLEVAIELLPKENVGIKYVLAQIYEKTNRLSLLYVGDLLITNFRIIFNIKNKNKIDFYWKKIKIFEYRKYGFEFTYGFKTYVIRIHDQETLNNTIENMISKKIVKFN